MVMVKEKHIKQDQVNNIWSKVWQQEDKTTPKMIFSSRLFIEGYPVFKKHFPNNFNRVIEIGGGTGRYGLTIAQEFPDAQVTITDIVDSSVKFIERLKNELNLTNVEVKKADVYNLEFREDYFDLIISDVVIQHLPNDLKAIKEMTKILKPGGVIIVSGVNLFNLPHTLYKLFHRKEYTYGYEKSYSKKELRRLYNEAGLEIINEDGFYFAYGIFRLKYIHSIFKLLGKAFNRITKFLDKFTNRYFSKKFGFEILIVGKK